ncbi:hypothetical protein GCM10023116_13690 [Kistimonas scapharcae]|uniref:Uncharacterized protein n=2 Tax=Kistimonas scapharcae TaxID=1036133 RepID=A0ABP8UZ22_9GAMM
MWLSGDSPYEEDNDDHFFDIRRLINRAITRSDWRLTETLLKARVDSSTVLMDESAGISPIPLLIEKHNNELQQQARNANIIIAELLTKHYLPSQEFTSFSQQWTTDDLCHILCQTIKNSDIKLWQQFFSGNYLQLDLQNIINLESLFKTPLERSLYYATVRVANKDDLKTESIAKPLQDALVEITRQGKSTLIATVIDMLSPRERDHVFSMIDEDQMTLLHHATTHNHIHIVRNLGNLRASDSKEMQSMTNH